MLAEFIAGGTQSGLPCFDDDDCSVFDYPEVSGSVSGKTITLELDGTADGGTCDGQSVSSSWSGTLINATTIQGMTESGRTFTFTKE